MHASVCVCVYVCRRDDLLPSHAVAKRPRSHKPPFHPIRFTLPNTFSDTRWWHVRTSLRPTHSPVVSVWGGVCVSFRARVLAGVYVNVCEHE